MFKVLSSSVLALACSLLAGCGGCDGADGMDGAEGPAGPLNPAPSLTSLSPAWGSALSQVTIKGANFSETADDNHVTFEGHPAHVVSATVDTLVVEPNIAVDEVTPAVVNVEVGNQVSNGLSFELVPSGTPRELTSSILSSPTSVVVLGGKLYIAAGNGVTKSAGLYVQDAGGYVTKVLGGERIVIDVTGTTFPIYDAPVGLATDGTYLYYSTALGDVVRYNPADGAKLKLYDAPLSGGSAFPHAPSLLVDGNYVLVLERHLNAVEIIDTTNGNVVSLGVPSGTVGIAGNATTLYLVENDNGRVDKVVNPRTSATFTYGLVIGVSLATSAVVSGTTIYVAYDGGIAYASTTSSSAATPGPLPDGRTATGLFMSGTTLYAAVPDYGWVYSIGAPALATATPVVGGLRSNASGATRIGDTLYLAEYGNVGHVLEVKPDGSFRMLAPGQAFDVVEGPAGTLFVSDCTAHTISSVDIASGTSTILLDAADGLGCPTGLYRDAAGVLYYFDPTVNGIGSLSGTTHTPNFASVATVNPIELEGIGNTMYVSTIGPSPAPIVRVSGNTQSTLSGLGWNASIGSINATASGRLLASRFDYSGLIENVDLTTGVTSPVATTRLDDEDIPNALFWPSGMTELADGSLVVQSELIANPITDIRLVITAP